MSDLINTEDLQQLKDIMDDNFDMLVFLFIEDSAKLINEIKEAYDSENSDALRIAAHTLKGSAANMCVKEVSSICKNIEDKAKNNDMQGIDALLTHLNVIHPQACELLKVF